MSAILDSMRTRPADLPRTITEKSREHAEVLRAALGRPAVHGQQAARSAVQQRIDAVRSNPSKWAGPTRVAAPQPVRKPDYKVADELAARTPIGYYALPRREASSAGNVVTFFKVHPWRGGHRIVQVIGSTGGYVERPLSVVHQVAALRHILEDMAASASLYGRTAKRCGFCAANGRNSELTNSRSLAVGYGQKCADTHGLPW